MLSKNVFTVYTFSKKISTKYIKTSLTAKVIVSIIFSIKNIVFLKNIFVIIISEDTPVCA